jgi:hypothetical protein
MAGITLGIKYKFIKYKPGKIYIIASSIKLFFSYHNNNSVKL